MKRNLQHWFLLGLLLVALVILPACGGGGGGGQVTGDSPQGVPLDSGLEEETGDGGEAIPEGGAGVEAGEVGPEDNLTDGQ